MLVIAELHWPGREGVQGRDARLERFGVRDDGFKVFDAYADMKLFLYLEVFEVQIVYSNRCLQRLPQYVYISISKQDLRHS